MLLKPFVRQGRLQVWADPYIEAGSVWRREIDGPLHVPASACVLLTPDLLASDFIADVELPLLLRAANASALTLLVVPRFRLTRRARPGSRMATSNTYQWPWSPAEPLEELPQDRRNRALVTVTDAIVRAAGSLARDAPLRLRRNEAERRSRTRCATGGATRRSSACPPSTWPAARRTIR